MADKIPIDDPTTQSNYTKIATTNVSLDWTVDFDKKSIYGSATHRLLASADVTEVMYVDPCCHPDTLDS
jgi:leukotriene-A4 hydrolase